MKPIPSDIADRLQGFLIETFGTARHLTALEVDDHWRLLSWCGEPRHFHLDLRENEDVRKRLPALFDLDVGSMQLLRHLETDGGVHFDLHLLPLKDGHLVVLLDTTDAVRRERALQQAANENALLNQQLHQLTVKIEAARREAEQASRLKSRFIAGMSHEFRTPLTAILGMCEIAAREEGQESERIAAIRRSSNHLLSLVENLLEHGRAEAGSIALDSVPVDLGTFFDNLHDMFAPLASQKGLDFSLVCERAPHRMVLADPVRLRQVLVNLLGNALRYTRQGEVIVRWRHDGAVLSVAVSDTGPGIPEDRRETIFQPFAQLEGDHGKGGIGLGLSITRQLVDTMAGTIQVYSEPGRGSAFLVELPLPLSSAPDAPQASEALPGVLVIDDDEDIRDVLAIVLGELAEAVYLAADGEAAMAVVEGHAPEIALVDLNLNGADGLDLVQALRQRDPGLQILAMSASNAETDRDRAREAGCVGFVTKPFDFQELEHELRRRAASRR